MPDPRTLFVASFDVDPAQEEAFDRWYTETHIPDALGIEGYRSVTAFRNAGPFENADTGASRLYIYELESLEAFRAGWASDYRRRSSEDFNRWVPALSRPNVGVYTEQTGRQR